MGLLFVRRQHDLEASHRAEAVKRAKRWKSTLNLFGGGYFFALRAWFDSNARFARHIEAR